MDNISIQKLKDTLSQNDRIAVAIGREPGLDEMAAALSLYLALKTANKKISIASPTQPIVALSSLVGIDQVKNSFGGASGDLVVSFPYREGEIEKVSYTIEDSFLNIVVKAGDQGLTFNEQDIKFTRGGGVPSLLFIVGTARLSDLGNLFNPEALKDTQVVNIDNKQENQGFGDLVIVSPKYSSVSEQMANIILSLGMQLDVDMSQNLLSGISQATNNFQDPKTSYIAFEMAAELLQRGAVRQRMSGGPAVAPVRSPMDQQRQAQNPFVQRPQQSMRQPMQQPQAQFRQPMQQQPFRQPIQQNPFAQSTGGMPQTQFRQPQMRQQSQNPFPRQPQISQQPFIQPQVQPMQQPQTPAAQPFNQPAPFPQPTHVQDQQGTSEQKDSEGRDTPPSDWLTPKVYKGSTNI